MDILLWLVPPVVVGVVAMLAVGWWGREGRGEVDRDEAVRRLGAALEREPRVRVHETRVRERSTSVALRRTPRRRVEQEPGQEPGQEPAADDRSQRRAS